MTTRSSRIEHASGTAVPVRGDDIDTDRIIPARFLKTITFEGLEAHVFEDDRKQAAEHGTPHPFDVPAHQGAHVLVVQGNFGCGSSREHAPQAIARWGIQAIVGESFAEIFFGNSLMIGLPCVTASRADLEKLLTLAETQPTTVFDVDLASGQLRAGSLVVPVTMPDAAREALRTGNWDATGLLVDRYEEVERTAARLPYLSGFAS
ncbi:MAG TPA: 3-isopropylmalate dehydratase small subunit [Vicinamibacterales bacterium]|nr:3-isopropylmalate dehydratase small subunit [Vicinamibacterales bacterium]